MKTINKRKQARNISIFIFAAVFMFNLIWFIASFIDVNIHNHVGEGYGQYQIWNMFTMFL